MLPTLDSLIYAASISHLITGNRSTINEILKNTATTHPIIKNLANAIKNKRNLQHHLNIALDFRKTLRYNEHKRIFKIVKYTENDGCCPYCNSLNTTSLCQNTIVNHTWEPTICNDCQEEFVKEEREGNVWYTKNQKVLSGIPNCFEDYSYTCKLCKGNVHKLTTNLDGIVSTWKIGKPFRTFYECQDCKFKIEYPLGYWDTE